MVGRKRKFDSLSNESAISSNGRSILALETSTPDLLVKTLPEMAQKDFVKMKVVCVLCWEAGTNKLVRQDQFHSHLISYHAQGDQRYQFYCKVCTGGLKFINKHEAEKHIRAKHSNAFPPGQTRQECTAVKKTLRGKFKAEPYTFESRPGGRYYRIVNTHGIQEANENEITKSGYPILYPPFVQSSYQEQFFDGHFVPSLPSVDIDDGEAQSSAHGATYENATLSEGQGQLWEARSSAQGAADGLLSAPLDIQGHLPPMGQTFVPPSSNFTFNANGGQFLHLSRATMDPFTPPFQKREDSLVFPSQPHGTATYTGSSDESGSYFDTTNGTSTPNLDDFSGTFTPSSLGTPPLFNQYENYAAGGFFPQFYPELAGPKTLFTQSVAGYSTTEKVKGPAKDLALQGVYEYSFDTAQPPLPQPIPTPHLNPLNTQSQSSLSTPQLPTSLEWEDTQAEIQRRLFDFMWENTGFGQRSIHDLEGDELKDIMDRAVAYVFA